MINSSSHALTICTQDEKFRRHAIPASYAALMLAGIATLGSLLIPRRRSIC